MQPVRLIIIVCFTLSLTGILAVGISASSGTFTTLVNGHITADTTWTAQHSPYVLSANVIVDENVVLTIEPGVTVEGAGHTLQVEGRLVVTGTQSERVEITDLYIKGFADDSELADWVVDIRFTTISGGGLLSPPSINDPGLLDRVGFFYLRDSLLTHVATIFVNMPHGDVFVERNSFLRSGEWQSKELQSIKHT